MSDTTGTYYYQPDRPEPADLLTSPPYQTGTDYDAACGSGAFLVQATDRLWGDPSEREIAEQAAAFRAKWSKRKAVQRKAMKWIGRRVKGTKAK